MPLPLTSFALPRSVVEPPKLRHIAHTMLDLPVPGHQYAMAMGNTQHHLTIRGSNDIQLRLKVYHSAIKCPTYTNALDERICSVKSWGSSSQEVF